MKWLYLTTFLMLKTHSWFLEWIDRQRPRTLTACSEWPIRMLLLRLKHNVICRNLLVDWVLCVFLKSSRTRELTHIENVALLPVCTAHSFIEQDFHKQSNQREFQRKKFMKSSCLRVCGQWSYRELVYIYHART